MIHINQIIEASTNPRLFILYNISNAQTLINVFIEKSLEVLSIHTNQSLFLEQLKEFRPGFCVLSLNVNNKESFDLIKTVRFMSPRTSVILVLAAAYAEELKIENLDVIGIIKDDFDSKEVVKCIDNVINGLRYISNRNKKVGLINHYEFLKLTTQETKIFNMISNGFINNNEIARKLYLSPHTVKNHKQNIIKKLNLSGVQELYWAAFR